MSDTKFTSTGLAELRANLEAAQRRTKEAMILAAVKHANRVMDASQALVPIDTGDLKISGEVLEPVVTDSDATVDLVYGSSGPTSNYAIVQHERLDFHHPNGGQAKYLEQPLLAMADDLSREIAEATKL